MRNSGLSWQAYRRKTNVLPPLDLADFFPGFQSQTLDYPPYEPASWQAEEFHKSDKHIKAIFGGDRAAKTGTVSYEFITLIRRFPGLLYWAVALTEDKLSAIWKWHKRLLAPHEIKYINWRVTEKIPKFVVLPDGGQIEYKMWKAGAGSFSAESVKVIQLDEDGERTISTAEQVYNDCLSRILDCDGYILLGATPVLGKNWMYRRLKERNASERKKMGYTGDAIYDPDIETWTASLLDNKFVSDDAKEKQRGRLTVDEIARRFYGLFTTLEGAIFKEWDEKRHVYDFGLLPKDIRKAMGIDLGAGHPFCALFGGLFDGKLYVWDEYYEDEKGSVTSKEHAMIIQEYEHEMKYFREGVDLFRAFEHRACDHDLQERIDLESFGLLTEPADKRTQLSWLIINRLLKEDKLIIHPRCFELQRTMPLYHYRKGPNPKEDQEKIDDDPVDALRYLVMYFFGGSDWDVSGIMSG